MGRCILLNNRYKEAYIHLIWYIDKFLWGEVRKEGRAVDGRKETRWPFFCRGAGHIHPLLSPSLLLPTTLPCQNINRNLYIHFVSLGFLSGKNKILAIKRKST
jgi:hypothetical protein